MTLVFCVVVIKKLSSPLISIVHFSPLDPFKENKNENHTEHNQQILNTNALCLVETKMWCEREKSEKWKQEWKKKRTTKNRLQRPTLWTLGWLFYGHWASNHRIWFASLKCNSEFCCFFFLVLRCIFVSARAWARARERTQTHILFRATKRATNLSVENMANLILLLQQHNIYIYLRCKMPLHLFWCERECARLPLFYLHLDVFARICAMCTQTYMRCWCFFGIEECAEKKRLKLGVKVATLLPIDSRNSDNINNKKQTNEFL